MALASNLTHLPVPPQHHGGRKPLPEYLQRVKLTGVRLTAYKIDALKTQGELTAVIEEALDDKYAELFQDVLANKRNETDNESLQATQEGAATYGGE